MKRILSFFLLAIICQLFPSASSAQVIFKTLSARNGLTSSQINCILKDDRGFMWFGTPAGLYRYDGYLFKHYQTDSQDGSSLPDSYIESIQSAIGGELWIKTASGYCIYHSQNESFDRDLRQVFARLGINDLPEIIYIDKKKNLWGYIPSKGVICYNMQQQLCYEFGYTNSAYAIPQGRVVSIGECPEGALVVYEDGRIVCCDATRQQSTPWRNFEIAQRKLRNSTTLKVFSDQLGNIWLYGQGTLFVYNRQSSTWDTTIGDKLGLTGANVDYSINAMEADRSNNIWMATSRDGLIRIDLNTREMERTELTAMGAVQRAAQANAIQSVYVDNSDLLWVGTAKAGVAYTGSNIYKFQSEIVGDVTAIVEDSVGHIWCGTSDNGVIGLEQPLASLKVTCMAYTNDGSLWVGSKQNGITRIKNGRSRIYSTASDSVKSTITNNNINDMCTDNMGNLWVATNGGLHIFNLKQEQFSVYNKENRKLQTNQVTSLYYASGNRMLIGTPEGLIVLNISTNSTKQYVGNSTHMEKFTNNYITRVFEDSRGLIWLGTRDGVNIFDLQSDKIINVTEKQGLCNNNICGISEDKNKNVWITTTNGVTRVVLQRNHEEGIYDYSLYNYSSSDGLQSDEFNLGSILRMKNGNVIMGGIFGTSTIRQHAESEESALPPVILTQLFIGEEEILTGLSYNGNVILRQSLNESNSIRLKNTQNTITVKFAAGNYNQSERLQFMYLMEGLDNDWKNGDPQKHGVTFENLASGKYRLHVKAISADGIISQKERVLEIIIDKPWYLQWWMLVFYGIVVITIIYLWKKGIDQIRDLWRRKNAVIAELAQQRDDIKAASDELRQPMSRMTSIIMNLAEREGTTEERDQLNALHTQMLTIITRVSDMQSALEHPEEKAKKNVKRTYELNSQGVMELPDLIDDELTSEIRQHSNSPTAKFRVVFIDDNTDFLKFVATRLKAVYEFHSYDDIQAAAHDIEAIVPDLVVCKQDMEGMTGSELCNNIKMHPKLSKAKFVILTEKKLSAKEMMHEGITLSADDYMFKPFNVREAAMRFNKLLGISAFDITSNLIEGAETRMLESHNSSMTTATETLPDSAIISTTEVVDDEMMQALKVDSIRKGRKAEELYDMPADAESMTGFDESSTYVVPTEETNEFAVAEKIAERQDYADDTSYEEDSEQSMSDAMDQQLIISIEQYVQQNMSRGPINLEEMAAAMGMSMKPFFQKVRDVTGKTPAEVVRDLRLKHACILLQRTNINMSELANNIGFATAEHFMNLFKERFGISPSEYRQRYRK